MKWKNYVACIFIAALLTHPATGQEFDFAIGTDIPYQFYAGVTLNSTHVDLSYRMGVFTTPYSDIILSFIEDLGTDESYIDLLDATYKFGWMNGLGVFYKFGNEKKWYAGTEFRFDVLAASDAPVDVLESITGEPIRAGTVANRELAATLGLRMRAIGLRLGRSFALDKGETRHFHAEFSLSKHVGIKSVVSVQNYQGENLDDILDDLLWDDVFKSYGFLGGLGFAYSHRL